MVSKGLPVYLDVIAAELVARNSGELKRGMPVSFRESAKMDNLEAMLKKGLDNLEAMLKKGLGNLKVKIAPGGAVSFD